MNSIFPFQVSIIWLFLIAFYYLFLGNVTFFKSNRYYLLGVLCLGLIVPLVQPYLIQNQMVMEPILLPTITISSQMTALESTNESITSYNLVSILYWMGVVFMSMRFMKGIIGIIWLVNGNKKEKIGNLTLIHLEKEMSPFSFFNYIFIHQKNNFTQEEWEQIYIHESTHAKQWHSMDILFTEILKIFFWWNPFLYAFQRALQEVHEYEADNAVKNIKNTKQYGLLLMKQSISGNNAALSNGFINSQLKKRIIMMTKKRSSQLTKMRYIWSLPLLILLALVTFSSDLVAQNLEPEIAQTQIDTITTFDPKTFNKTVQVVKNIIYKNQHIDQIATISGCESLASEEEQADCTNTKLLQAIHDNLKYPKDAMNAKKEGIVMIEIDISSRNDITMNPVQKRVIVRYLVASDFGYGMGKEVVRALKAANLDWRSAKHNGEELDVQLILPVEFKN